MRRVAAAALIAYACLISPRLAGRQQLPPDPVFTASGVHKDRDYFSGADFERIDTLNGNLVLTFTDLVLPGPAGMDLRFQRTYNSNGTPSMTPVWNFGIAGVPLTIQYPDGPTIFTQPPLFPIAVTGDGALHRMRPNSFQGPVSYYSRPNSGGGHPLPTRSNSRMVTGSRTPASAAPAFSDPHSYRN
jgi:hypothetical protein